MRFLSAALALSLLLAPALADARPGLGGSLGSRGARTWSSTPGTAGAPGGAYGFSQSMTPNGGGYGSNYGNYGGYRPGYGAFGGGSMFGRGLMGGFLGAGLFGLLFGGRFFGFHGGMGFMGLLIQGFLLFLLFRWLRDRFLGGPALAGGVRPGFARPGFMPGGPGGFFRSMFPPLRTGGGFGGGGAASGFGGAARGTPITLSSADYQQFSSLLQGIQTAWSNTDLNGLRAMCTPEMLGYFNTQLSELASRGERNQVRDVRLQQGDLSEAWSERGTQYATVSLRYSMVDVTLDRAGRVVDGSPTERVTVTEFWTFVRASAGHWILSAIQQAR